jgi:cytochrome P450
MREEDMAGDLAPTPAHVPAALVRDVDIYDPAGWREAGDPLIVWKQIQDSHPPIFWTPRQGGHWIVTRFDDIQHVAATFDDFSSRENFIPRGVTIPQMPMNLDPPEHTAVRRLLAPAVMPLRLRALQAQVRQWTIEAIEALRLQGECEFIVEFSSAIPVKAFLAMMGLPIEDHALLNRLGADITKINEPEVYRVAKAQLTDYIMGWIEEFRRNPGEGIISDAIHNEIDGRRLTDEEVENLCVMLLAAGIDTVKSAIVFMANLLAASPAHRLQLIDDPTLIPNAVEETLRRYGSSNLARVVRHDLDYKGVALKAGDMVCLPYPLAGLDSDENDDPLTVDFTREKIRHLNFGAGPHLCIGQALARNEIVTFTEEWLKRIPEFRIKPGTKMKAMTGLSNIPLELHLEWDPATTHAIAA